MPYEEHKWFIEHTSPATAHMFGVENFVRSFRTNYQQVEIADTSVFGRILILDGKIQSSAFDEYIYHEALVHPAMLMCPNPRRVLVIGGGEGATLREVLKHHGGDHPLLGLDLFNLKGATSHRCHVERRRRQIRCADTRNLVPRQNAHGRVIQKRGEGLGEDELHRQLIDLVDLDHPPYVRTQLRRTRKLSILEEPDGEDDVVGGDGCPIVPVRVGTQVEKVGEPVSPNLPAARQVWLHLPILVQTGQAAEYQGTQILVGRVEAAQQRIKCLRSTGDALHIGASMPGPENGRVVDGQIRQEQHQEDDADQDDKHLPLDVSGHGLHPACAKEAAYSRRSLRTGPRRVRLHPSPHRRSAPKRSIPVSTWGNHGRGLIQERPGGADDPRGGSIGGAEVKTIR